MSADKTEYFIGIFTVTASFPFKRPTVCWSFYDFSNEFMSVALNGSIRTAPPTHRRRRLIATSTRRWLYADDGTCR